jgi:hypothetical protein
MLNVAGLPAASGGMGRYAQALGASAAPAGPGGAAERPFLGSGPFWVLVFLAVGYILVFQTLRD